MQKMRIRLLLFNNFFYQLCAFNKGLILTFPLAFEAPGHLTKYPNVCTHVSNNISEDPQQKIAEVYLLEAFLPLCTSISAYCT